MELVFATHNQGKVEEVCAILPEGVRLLDSASVGIHDEIPEDFDTLEANSLQKAMYVYQALEGKYCCLADDTGLEVEALGGAPGVYSARYAGPACNFSDNIAKLLEALGETKHRVARFRTILTFVHRDEQVVQFEGEVTGEILYSPEGDKGFGYDPIFRPLGYTESFARMSPARKNRLSHRGRALEKLITYLQSIL